MFVIWYLEFGAYLVMQNLDTLSKILNIKFKDIGLLKNAFIHRSYLNEIRTNCSSNERLEFLGDSILSYLVSDFLYKKYPNLPEGELTNLRSSMVKTTSLAALARKLNLGKYIFLSKGEEEGGGRDNPSLLADTFEALLGAIYLDQGINKVSQILNTYLYPQITKIINNKSYKDAKSIFQELVQEKTKISPIYKVINEKGPDHLKQFTVAVFVDNNKWGEGTGKSKQIAEQNAAKDALEKWRKT